jgi:DNA-binding transcriptional ArsR family regulator
MKPITNIDDPRYVKAMSHPLRVRILAMLDERTASPVELAGWLGASLGTVAYHVRTLERIGLIELVHETRVRGAVEHHYRSCARPTVTDEAWAAAPAIAKQAAVSSSLQTIDAYTRAASAAGGFDSGNSHLTRTTLELDARGWSELSRACVRLLSQIERIEDSAKERMQLNPHSGETHDIALVMMLF